MRVQGGTYKWKKAAEKQLCVLDIKGAAGIVYGYRVLLAILAFLLYKMNLDQAKVSGGIIVIYIVSTFIGG